MLLTKIPYEFFVAALSTRSQTLLIANSPAKFFAASITKNSAKSNAKIPLFVAVGVITTSAFDIAYEYD